jgi:hypothetical protein
MLAYLAEVPVSSRRTFSRVSPSRWAERITPQEAGLPAPDGNRRVPGLRREEVAILAGVSVDYYTRLERGNACGASESVLEALGRALQLDEAERTYLFNLVDAANTTATARVPRRPAGQQVRPSVQRVLDSMTTAAAVVRNGRQDILAANQLGRALYSPRYDDPARPVNHARFIFLDPRARSFYAEWERLAPAMAGLLRAEAARSPDDQKLAGLIEELSTRSKTFHKWWAAHNVHTLGCLTPVLYRHPVAGELSLAFEALDISLDPGLRITVYTAEPRSPSEGALNLLAGWAATPDWAETAADDQTSAT